MLTYIGPFVLLAEGNSMFSALVPLSVGILPLLTHVTSSLLCSTTDATQCHC